MCQYLNELPPRNSRSSEVGGICASEIGRMYFRNFNKRWASACSAQFSGTYSNSGSTWLLMTASSKSIAELNIASAFS